MAQFIACLQGFFGRIVGMQHVEVSNHLQGDDLFPPCRVNQQVSCDLEQKGPAAVRPVNIAACISAGHAFSDDVVNIVAAGHHAAQSRPQRAFIWQNGLLEPVQPSPDRFGVHAYPLFLPFLLPHAVLSAQRGRSSSDRWPVRVTKMR
jgi:hypothetical protein